MQHILSVERAARRKAEKRLEDEVVLRQRAETQLAALKSDMARIESSHRQWIKSTAEILADNVSHFTQSLASHESLSSVLVDGKDSASSTGHLGDRKGKRKMCEV